MESPTFTAIKEAIEKQATAFDAFKSVNDERIKAISDGKDSLAAELSAKLGPIEIEVRKFTELKKSMETEMMLNRERLEELEARASQPRKSPKEILQDEYHSNWKDWVRCKGSNPLAEAKMTELAKKDVTIASPTGGGYGVPEQIARDISRQEMLYSPVRSLVKVVQSGTSDYKELVDLNGTSAGWVGETGARNATKTSQLREVVPTHGEIYAYPQATEWSLDDVFFNVDAWITDSCARAFAVAEGAAVISGDANSKPTGMLHTTPVLTADHASPLRAPAAYQYIACLSDSSPKVAEILGDHLIDLQYALNSAYRARSTWVMNSNTTGAVRKMKDKNGQYLWQPSLIVGQPDMLLGRPVATWEQMDDVGTNKFPVALGDYAQGYLLVDRVGLRMTRDNVTNVGFVRYYIRRREGGIVLNNDSIKFLRTTIA